jgi:prefoldin subunit 5
MSVSSRISGKEYSSMNSFVADLQLGIAEEIATALNPLKQDINNLKQDIRNLRQQISDTRTPTQTE